MGRWFEDKFEREKIRRYTRKRMDGEFLNGFFRKLSITNWIIIVNVIIFFIMYLAMIAFGEEAILNLFALQANSFFAGKIWTVFTSMFMHGSFFHLFVNMFSMFFVGNFIEKLIGRKRLFWFYILSGIFAGLFFVFLSYYLGSICIVEFFGGCLGAKIFSSPLTSAVGASGAIFALAGLLAVLTPKNKVYLIAGPLIAIIIQSIAASIPVFSSILPVVETIVTFYIIISLISMFSLNPVIRRLAISIEMRFWVLPFIAIIPLVVIGLFVDLPIGNMAHLGGLLVGIGYGMYLRKKYRKKTEMISKMFSK